jgi:hypothetical protein
LQRLRERPPAIWYGGEQVADVTAHPAFAGGVRTLAELNDLQWQDPDVSLFVAEAGGPLRMAACLGMSIRHFEAASVLGEKWIVSQFVRNRPVL